MAVNGIFASSLTKPGMSRGLVIRWFCAPNFMNTRQFAVSAKMWYSGSAVTMSSLPDYARCRRSRPRPAACWRPGCGGSASRPWPRRWCRRCTAGRRCLRASISTSGSLCMRPRVSASLEADGSGDVVVGHHLLTYFSTKLTIAPFGKPSMSPRPVVITCFTGVSASTSCTVWPKLSQHHERAGAGIDQLVLELARGVHRVDVHHGQPGAQDAEDRDRGTAGSWAS